MNNIVYFNFSVGDEQGRISLETGVEFDQYGKILEIISTFMGNNGDNEILFTHDYDKLAPYQKAAIMGVVSAYVQARLVSSHRSNAFNLG